MGLHDRPYWRGEGGGSGYGDGGGPGLRTIFGGMPKPTLVVKWLMIANFSIFVLQAFLDDVLVQSFAGNAALWWQVWRYVTFQFLHGSILHVGFNMLALYFLGTMVERTWGSRRFLRFYLICGVVAGLCHVLLAYALRVAGQGDNAIHQHLIGASGGVTAVMVAAAVLFPHTKLILLVFPVPIRLVTIIFLGLGVYEIIASFGPRGGGDNVSHAAHVGGAIAAAVYMWVLPRLRGAAADVRVRRKEGAWARKVAKRNAEQEEVNRILDKIRDEGINSLSVREKRVLREATEKQREEEQTRY